MVRIEQDEDGWYIVSSDLPLLHGWGLTVSEAMADYEEGLEILQELVAIGASKGCRYDQALLRLWAPYVQPHMAAWRAVC